MFLEKDIFQTVIASAPLVSIDLIVRNTSGEYLLGYRKNKPAQGFWFVLGGRILKGEAMHLAFTRLVRDELGIYVELTDAVFNGVYEHFYDDYVFGDEVSTHYVVLAYELIVDIALTNLPKAQHSDYKWFGAKEFSNAPSVHNHSKWYLSKEL
jgi:colanic acid biosynthesis protein WcaH|tara:strand:- start:669 stop:1127 length:459 start_codon:yes stop_codon:yes gene_type:complete